MRLCFAKDLQPFVDGCITPAESVEQDLAHELIYKVHNHGAKEKASTFRTSLMSMFKFAIDYDLSPERYKLPNVYNVKFNPIRDIALKVKKNASQGWLTEEEIKIIWNAPGQSHNARYYFRLNLALAGQRIQEVYHANISEFNFEDRIFTIPKECVKIKSHGDHVAPLSDLAIEILNELKPHIGPTGLLFAQRWRLDKPGHYSGLLYPFHRACKLQHIPKSATQDIR